MCTAQWADDLIRKQNSIPSLLSVPSPNINVKAMNLVEVQN